MQFMASKLCVNACDGDEMTDWTLGHS